MRFFFVFVLSIIACRLSAMVAAGDTAVYTQTFCSNQIIIINNHVYGPFNPEGLEVIPGGGWNGMDSIFRVVLTFAQAVETDYNVTICEGDSIEINNKIYHQGFYEGTEVFENAASNGCDSIVHIQLSFIPAPFSNLVDTLCADAFVLVNGTRYDMDNRSGLEIIQGGAASGCDSLVYVSLFFREQWVYIGADTVVVQGDSLCIALSARFDPALVEWNPLPPCADPECVEFCTGRLLAPAKYSVIYTDLYGCTSTDEITINIDNNHKVYGPNVFTPRSDRPNNRFFIGADNGVVNIRQLVVFDRWGEIVFRETDIPNSPPAAYNQGWDGTIRGKFAFSDVYGWWAELETYSGERFIRSGDVTLIK